MWLSHLVAMGVAGAVCDKLAICMLIHIYKKDINNNKLF
jgi:hypothetical protein